MTNRLGEGKLSTFKLAAWVQPSPTLYITNIPPPDNALVTLEANLRTQAGFEAPMRLGKGGAVVFADFKDVQSATDAMHKLMGLQFDNWSGEGLRISYDKDDSKERRQQRAEKEALGKANSMCPRLMCNICGTFCIKLSKPLEKLPRRGTDSSHVIDEAKHLVELKAKKGEVKHIKRDKGVETQCRLECEQCYTLLAPGCILGLEDTQCLLSEALSFGVVPVSGGYRPVPIGEPTKYMYLLPDVNTDDAALRAGCDLAQCGASTRPSPRPEQVRVGEAEAPVRAAEKCKGAWPAPPAEGTAPPTGAAADQPLAKRAKLA